MFSHRLGREIEELNLTFECISQHLHYLDEITLDRTMAQPRLTMALRFRLMLINLQGRSRTLMETEAEWMWI